MQNHCGPVRSEEENTLDEELVRDMENTGAIIEVVSD